jgi:hypothetical protein
MPFKSDGVFGVIACLILHADEKLQSPADVKRRYFEVVGRLCEGSPGSSVVTF